MARFTATWTDTEATDFEAGDVLRTDKIRDQIGQNIEYLKTQVDSLATSVSKSIWFYGSAAR